MATFYDEPSHTFSEYLLIPGYTGPDNTPDHVSLRTPLG
jgi:IMP dehydrogenase